MSEETTDTKVAVLKQRVDVHDREIESLRFSRHEHGNRLQALMTAPEDIRELQDLPQRVETAEKAIEMMRETVVPAIHESLEEQAAKIAAINDKLKDEKSRWAVIGDIMKTVARVAEAVGVAFLIWWVTK